MDGIIWKGSPNHYTGRQGYGVTHITLHIMVGYLAGTDSTFANPSSQSSAHYGVGATGEIHQYVAETDGSYSDANYASNCSTISIEHEGGMADGAVCTPGVHRRKRPIVRRHRAPVRVEKTVARRTEGQCLVAQGDPRHRSRGLSGPRAQRPAVSAGHR